MALLTSDDELLRALALSLLTTAQQHDAHTLSRLHTVPGMGKIRSLVLLYAIHDMDRCPRVQDVASSCRLGKCAKASAGTRVGPSGKQIGNAHRTWAFAEAAVLFWRNNPQGQKSLARLENKPDKGTALTILAHTLARAVSDRLKRQTAVDMDVCLRASGSRAGAPAVSLDAHGLSLHPCPWNL